MRYLLIATLVVLPGAAQRAQDTASVFGIVHSPEGAANGVRYTVIAEPEQGISAGSAAGTTPGSYEIKLKPGKYRIIAAGAFGSGVSPQIQRSITLLKGQRLAMDFALAAPGTIVGQVLDANDQPVRGVQVRAVDKRYNRGALRYWPILGAATDEHGAYRIEGVPPGRSIIVRADATVTRGSSAPDTYFPGTTAREDAEQIVLAAGEVRTGINIRRKAALSYCVDGLADSVSGADSMWWEVTRAGVGAEPDQLASEKMLPASGEALQQFEICGLHNGDFLIGVTTSDLRGRPPVFLASEGAVVVAGADVHGLRLRPQAPVTISGKALWDGQAGPEATAKVAIHFQGGLRMGGFGPPDIPVPENFSFAPNLFPEVYVIDRVDVVQGSGAYIQEVTWNGLHPPGNTVALGGDDGGGVIRVEVRADGAAVNVKVVDERGHIVPNAYVAMIPTSVTTEAEVAATMIFGQADQNGNYSAPTVPPGEYRILVIGNVIDGAANTMSGWGFATDRAASLVSVLWASRTDGQLLEIAPKEAIELTLKLK